VLPFAGIAEVWLRGNKAGANKVGQMANVVTPGKTAKGADATHGTPINGATRNIPLGLKNESHFLQASQELKDALHKKGFMMYQLVFGVVRC
jgi:hypothetical protein